MKDTKISLLVLLLLLGVLSLSLPSLPTGRQAGMECIGAIETVERDWSETRFHKWRSSEVPSFDGIPCGWAEAIRRYNGSGADAEANRDEILTRITGAERTYIA